eukprot:GEMP01029114.1.p1 GENE.GEMP01029114.1~~GEMP01029114.1.p1  ORF type:complete len:548 (+),score=123.39 GEMP01029114.1:155-1798(+)
MNPFTLPKARKSAINMSDCEQVSSVQLSSTCAAESSNADEDAPEHSQSCPLPREIRDLLRLGLPLAPLTASPAVSSTASPVKSRKLRRYRVTPTTTPRGDIFLDKAATDIVDDTGGGAKVMESTAGKKYEGTARTGMDLVHKCSRGPMVRPRIPTEEGNSVSPFATKRLKQMTQPHVRTFDDRMTSIAPTIEDATVAPHVSSPSGGVGGFKTKQTNFRRWNYFSNKIPFDRFPLLSTLCESETSKAEDEAPGSRYFLPLRAFNDEHAYDSFNMRKEKMEQLLKAMHGKANTNTEESLLLTSLWGIEGSEVVQLEKMIPTFFWIGHTERYQAALKLLASAFSNAKSVSLEDIILLIKPGDLNDKSTQLEFGSSLENMAKQNGERVVEFSQRKIRSWFKQLHPVKGHDRSRKKIIRSIQQLCHVNVIRPALQGSTRSLEPTGLWLSVTDFDRLLSRCILAHALDKVRTLVDSYSELRVDLKCAAIQREIVVSLLINNQFWGEKEVESVMASLLRVHGDVTSDDRAFFQKAKAQGMHVIYEDLERTGDAD